MKFKIINSDQGHNYTHYVDAPDRQTAMERFKAGHYGFIIDCEEVKPATEDKKAPVPITISKSDGTGEIEILPEVKNIAIAWIENYVPHGSIVPEIGQKWKLAEDIQRVVNQERNRAIQECISRVKNQLLSRLDTNNLIAELEKLKK